MFFGKKFVESLDSYETEHKHHSEAITYHWNARLALINCELEMRSLDVLLNIGAVNQDNYQIQKDQIQKKWYPQYWAYISIWSRGNMKTTIARACIIVDALLSIAHGVKGYALIVGGTVKKVKGTATSISTMLQDVAIKKYAPKLAQVKKSDKGQSQGWTADFINTAADYVFHFIGLDQGVAGANVEGVRPTFIVPDDVDDREDSHVISAGRLSVLTRSVIPTKQWNTLYFFAQNMISRFSVLYQIYKQQVRVLANRYVTEPIPAVIGLETEEQTINGVVKDVVVGGVCTWRGWNLNEVQNQIDTMTLPIFKLECQHEVEGSKEGLVHKKYNDNVHPISYSQFAAVYGSADAWKYFNKVPFSDWARTKTKYHANVAGYVAVSNQNSRLPGHVFVIPLSFPKDSDPADVAVRMLNVLTPYAYTGPTPQQSKTWDDLVDESWKRTNSEEHFSDVAQRLDFLKKHYARLIPKYSKPILKQFRVRPGVNSHSEDKVREMFNKGFGFSFSPSNPPEHGALEDIDEVMRFDMKEPHYFDPNKFGYSRFHVLCKDDLTKQPVIVNGMKVYPPVPFPNVINPDLLHDDDLFRYQMCNRSYAEPELTKTGEKIDVFLKLHDDFGQALQMIFYKKLLHNLELTDGEYIEEVLPQNMTVAAIEQIENPIQLGLTLQRRLMTIKQIQGDKSAKTRAPGLNRIRRR